MTDEQRIEAILWEALRLKVLNHTLTAERAVAQAETNLGVSMHRSIRDKLDYIREQGLTVADVERGAHYKIKVRRPGEDRTHLVVASSTSASARGFNNFKALVRRIARGIVN